MLNVITLKEANRILCKRYARKTEAEEIPLASASGRVLAQDALCMQDLPAFVRSSMDGYAVRARDTFGASESVPAMLRLIGEAEMGRHTALAVQEGECVYVPTGGELPEHADAVVMLEYAEPFADGLVALEASVPPGRNVVWIGDDMRKGEIMLRAGERISARSMGVLSSLGYAVVRVFRKPRVAVLSTGDEIVPTEETPLFGQVRDVNGPLLTALCTQAGADAHFLGVVKDEEDSLLSHLREATKDADLVLVSGGSSVGAKDAAARCVSACGEILFHGLAVKPGKPTFAGEMDGVPIIGLPGHPTAAALIGMLLVRPLLAAMQGEAFVCQTSKATLTEAIPSNHGREEYVAVCVNEGLATPLFGKSGLISLLCRADGYVCVPRNSEGLRSGETVDVTQWSDR